MFRKTVMFISAMVLSFGLASTVFAQTPVTVTIPVSYQVTEDMGVRSVFTLTANESWYWKVRSPMPEGSSGGKKEITMTSSGKVDFGEFKFTENDVYEYTLKKTTTDLPGMTKDNRTYTILIMVENGEAQTIIRNIDNGEKPEAIEYVDVVLCEAKDDSPVLKKVEGNAPTKEEFSFKLKDIGSNPQPMPEGAENGELIIKAKPGVETEFGELIFTKPGEYYYEVTEVNTGLAGYKYDGSVYRLKYVVTHQDGKWVAVRTMTKDGQEVHALTFTFTNVYTPPEGETTTETPGSSTSTPGSDKPSKIYEKTIGRVTKTGDTFNMFKMAVMFLISGCAVAAFLISRRREKKTEKQ